MKTDSRSRMPNLLVKTAVCLFAAGFLFAAQAQEVVERSTSAPPPVVETRTYEKDGKLYTERVTTSTVRELESRTTLPAPKTIKAAIFVTNRAGASLDGKVRAFEDFLTSRISDAGFSIISREIAIGSLRALEPATAAPRTVERTTTEVQQTASASGGTAAARLEGRSQVIAAASAQESGHAAQAGHVQGAVMADSNLGVAGRVEQVAGASSVGYQQSQNQMVAAEQAQRAMAAEITASGQSAEASRVTRVVQELAPESVPGDLLDQVLSNNTSALRLAQDLGADYLLVASLASYGTKTRNINTYGVQMLTAENTLRVSYKILDAAAAGSLIGDTVKVSNSQRQTANATEVNSDSINELLDEAAVKVADSLIGKKRSIAAPAAPAKMATVTIECNAGDLFVPDVRIGSDNTVAISEAKWKVQALDVTVEVNGTAVGSAPSTFQVRPGLSKLRLSRQGYRDWEKTVNLFDGQRLSVALTLDDSGYARWKDATKFMNDLKNGAKLTDAEVKRIEGDAKRLEQSGYKINVDTKEALHIENKHQSIFD